jgi:hypothetical protein
MREELSIDACLATESPVQTDVELLILDIFPNGSDY